jgi:prevent-host-death family protein
MKIANATEVKNRFGEFLDDARDEPVVVSKTGRKVAVILSWREFERLSALDDAWWGIQAQLAEHEGYMGPEAAMEFIRKRMNEET